jgi:beta-lactamase superfamily II metal-dependent hydrolase
MPPTENTIMAETGTTDHDKPKDGTTEAAHNAPAGGRVTVRHYCQGIGDCHLLGFPKPDGKTFWMLIDCGVHSSVSGGSAKIDQVVEDIAGLTLHLDVIVVTHEHTDHISGFLTAAQKFKPFTVGEIWMAWTENPKDPQAQQLDKYKQQALAALQMTRRQLDNANGMTPHLTALRTGLDALLGFNFGAKGDRVRAFRDAAVKLANGIVRYCEPTDEPITLGDLPSLRIYVLGPPRDPKLLGLTERSSEMYHAAAGSGGPITQALSGGFAAGAGRTGIGADCAAPFDLNVGTDLAQLAAPGSANIAPEIADFAHDRYFGPATTAGTAIRSRRRTKAIDPNEHDQSWRRIDLDWLGISADLAMQLDNKTNNTSLVLAFEFTDTKRVLLFAADAQVGSWLSWQNTQWKVDGGTVTGPDLLARTVYLKVGHHGSHNATLKEKGLELMKSKDLSAFIPTNEEDAKKVGWGRMPLNSILDALGERCGGRVIRADDPWISEAAAKRKPATKAPIRAPSRA